MDIDFSKLTSTSNQTVIEPRDIFMALPKKDKIYGYPRDVPEGTPVYLNGRKFGSNGLTSVMKRIQ